MSFQYKTVLMLGATSGIGLALAEKMIEAGTHVIAVGRRQEQLDNLVTKHGKDKVSSYKFDITELDKIPSFAESVIKNHPTLDCVFLNSGLQRPLNFAEPESIDLGTVSLELTTNYTSYIHLCKAFLPFLLKASSPTSLAFTTSGLALIPLVRVPGYCASKAALHHLILAMRIQLEGSNVKVIEVLPPAVKTELHDDKHQPDLKGKGKDIGMPLEEFTKQAWAGLVEGKEQIPVGMAEKPYEPEGFETRRQKAFMHMVEMVKKQQGP